MKIIKIIVLVVNISLAFSFLNCSHVPHENVSKLDPKTIELIDLYRQRISYQIDKNWELTEKISSDSNPMVKIVFRVTANGAIKNVRYIKKSGYPALDKSAYLAVQRAKPVESFPKELKKYPYMEIGVVFTSNGVKMK